MRQGLTFSNDEGVKKVAAASKMIPMKLQDVTFFLSLIVLLILKRPVYFVWAGLGCLVLAIPLFATWTFFTAERLTWYAAAFFLAFILISLLKPHKVQ